MTGFCNTNTTETTPGSCLVVSKVGGSLGCWEVEWRLGDTGVEGWRACMFQMEEMSPLDSTEKKGRHPSPKSATFKKSPRERDTDDTHLENCTVSFH